MDTFYATWTSSDSVIPLAKSLMVNAVIGGKIEIMSEANGVEWRMVGSFAELEPNRRLSISWDCNSDGEVSRVGVEFSDEKEEATRIEMLHTGFSKEDSLNAHDLVRDLYLGGLKSFIESLS